MENYVAAHVGWIDDELKEQIEILFQQFLIRWNKAKRMKDRFSKKNAEWLEDFFVVCKPSSSSFETNKGGRPLKEFVDCSNRSKRRRTNDLRKTFHPRTLFYYYYFEVHYILMIDLLSTVGELQFATEVVLREEGQQELADILKTGVTIQKLCDN